MPQNRVLVRKLWPWFWGLLFHYFVGKHQFVHFHLAHCRYVTRAQRAVSHGRFHSPWNIISGKPESCCFKIKICVFNSRRIGGNEKNPWRESTRGPWIIPPLPLLVVLLLETQVWLFDQIFFIAFSIGAERELFHSHFVPPILFGNDILPL